ncbi:AI-2E family transporter [Klugiella xanthotipulae]|uniref:Putative PurR-regulated permease PerM n=1 Tax=Klugiella xanthotipulae TaxID=244735 RepID=A0A543HRX0_9MICO|nr:AI-2E family transporter [Klugiella xanthotipulae]TQM61093.1 putative PurR-regulated permease PerM [Klugiella xanthotipulae]
MRVQNAFQIGLVATLGVGVGLLIWAMLGELATVFTYVGAAAFLALGLDPVVTWLESKRFPRWAALLTVVLGVIGVFGGLLSTVIPLIVRQASSLVANVTHAISSAQSTTGSSALARFIEILDERFSLRDYINIDQALDAVNNWVSNPDNIASVGSGVLEVGAGIASGLFGAIVILILTLYFTGSMHTIKSAFYRLVPATKREGFVEISEQITNSVGKYVVGQLAQASINGILSIIFLSVIKAPYPVLLATIAFLFSLIPLVGTLTGALFIVAVCLFAGPTTALVAGIYYLVYMQVEAYVISPRIMGRAVQVPASVVVIAALAGGTLLGLLGALIAIPVAASVMILLRQVVLPRINEL